MCNWGRSQNVMNSPNTYSYSLQIVVQGLQLLLVHLLLS